MIFDHVRTSGWAALTLCLGLWSAVAVEHQPGAMSPGAFAPGSVRRASDLPPGRFRKTMEQLPPEARQRAIEWLGRFQFAERDLDSLRVDEGGGVYYADSFILEAPGQNEAAESPVASPGVPSSPLPALLKFHSKPGAPNVLYLNFTGESVSGTAWNASEDRDPIPATAFSTDSDFSTFNEAEQSAIRRIWQRVAEDYAPFDVDVTTERPAAFGRRTGHALITRSTDLNGEANPSSSGGGVAYVAVFGNASFDRYQPAWIYYDRLAYDESYIAEAVSHELGHNMGLSHDGLSGGAAYYTGHGSGEVSWGPIMGAGYRRDVTQWSRGEYFNSNNSQDDLSIIAGRLNYRNDDHGNDPTSATPLVVEDGVSIVASNPETDPDNLQASNKGIIERESDVDVFSFETGNGPVNLMVSPWISMAGATRGGNLDVRIELYDGSGLLVGSVDAASRTSAELEVNLLPGVYFLHVRSSSTGNPTVSPPSGYTAYGSLGQYFITGTLTSPASSASAVALQVTVNNPTWGTVTPGSGSYPVNESLTLTAQPASHFQFSHWSGDLQGTGNPTSIALAAPLNVQANFIEIMTTNRPTPVWWLAGHGLTNDLEDAVELIGSNGIPVWESYVAGLDPNDPESQLRTAIEQAGNGSEWVVHWNAVSGRVYTVLQSTNPAGPFSPMPGAIDLPYPVEAVPTSPNPPGMPAFFRVEVRLP